MSNAYLVACLGEADARRWGHTECPTLESAKETLDEHRSLFIDGDGRWGRVVMANNKGGWILVELPEEDLDSRPSDPVQVAFDIAKNWDYLHKTHRFSYDIDFPTFYSEHHRQVFGFGCPGASASEEENEEFYKNVSKFFDEHPDHPEDVEFVNEEVPWLKNATIIDEVHYDTGYDENGEPIEKDLDYWEDLMDEWGEGGVWTVKPRDPSDGPTIYITTEEEYNAYYGDDGSYEKLLEYVREHPRGLEFDGGIKFASGQTSDGRKAYVYVRNKEDWDTYINGGFAALADTLQARGEEVYYEKER